MSEGVDWRSALAQQAGALGCDWRAAAMSLSGKSSWQAGLAALGGAEHGVDYRQAYGGVDWNAGVSGGVTEPAPQDPPVMQAGTTLRFGVTSTANSGTVSTTITVPDDAEIALVAISCYGRSGTPNFQSNGVVTFTKGGVDTPMLSCGNQGDTNDKWASALWYLPLPDTGVNKSLKWNHVGSDASGFADKLWSITFWKNIDTDDPVRSTTGGQANSAPLVTPYLDLQDGDLAVAFIGGFTPGGGTGVVSTWHNLDHLTQLTKNGVAEGGWATGSHGVRHTTGIRYVGNGTDLSEPSVMAVALKQRITPPVNTLNLPRISWEGGAAYWAQFPKAHAQGWSNPAFFPISVFLGKCDSGHPAALASLGINTYMAVEHQAPISQATDHLFVIAQSPISHTGDTWTQVEIGSNPKVVGWFIYDECEQAEGACAAWPTDAERLSHFTDWTEDTRAFNDGRFIYANFGNGALNSFWAPETMDQWMATVDACAVDKYAYTSGGVQFITDQSGDWPGTLAQTISSASYGFYADQMRRFDNENTERRPIWGFVETQMPFLGGGDTRAIITYAQIAGAAWTWIAHEARGIAYFQHNGFYDQGTPPAIDPNTGLAPNTSTYSLVTGDAGLKSAVTTLNAQITALAPVINTQSYVWDFGATGIFTMLKAHGGFAYIFAVMDIAAATGSKTFTLPPLVTGSSAVVVDESRSVSITGGQFTDTFSNEYSHHIYKVALCVAARRRGRPDRFAQWTPRMLLLTSAATAFGAIWAAYNFLGLPKLVDNITFRDELGKLDRKVDTLLGKQDESSIERLEMQRAFLEAAKADRVEFLASTEEQLKARPKDAYLQSRKRDMTRSVAAIDKELERINEQLKRARERKQ